MVHGGRSGDLFMIRENLSQRLVSRHHELKDAVVVLVVEDSAISAE
jgi:hypothetical protein|tara:strand:+ start:679 stop:816 length:138 start_codon:yes stop_codon:yes gene_type:complete